MTDETVPSAPSLYEVTAQFEQHIEQAKAFIDALAVIGDGPNPNQLRDCNASVIAEAAYQATEKAEQAFSALREQYAATQPK